MITVAQYAYWVWSTLRRYNSGPSDLPILLLFSLSGLLLSLFAAMHLPEFAPPAEFQSSIFAEVSAPL